MKYFIFLIVILSSCGYSMTKEELKDIKYAEQMDFYKQKQAAQCETEYWIEVNTIADSLLAVAAIGQTDSLTFKTDNPRPQLKYKPRFKDTLDLDPLFESKIK